MDSVSPAALAKQACRRHLRQVLRGLSPQSSEAQSRAIREHLKSLPEILAARTIMLYAALPGEPDLDDLLAPWALSGKTPVFPRIEGPPPGRIVAVRVRSEADLVPGYRGIREPGPDCPPIELARIDLVLVPGLGFSSLSGARIGKGRGHYDTFLTACEAARGCPLPAYGVAFREQCLPAADLPLEAHDRLLDGVITADGLMRRTTRCPAEDGK